MDLIVISESANPPVAKIADFNKFLYKEKKKSAASKTKSKKSELKEFRFGPSIGEEDLRVRIERSRQFLKENNRVKLSVILKGREQAHPELGYEKLKKALDGLKDIAKSEKEPTLIGSTISVIVVAK